MGIFSRKERDRPPKTASGPAPPLTTSHSSGSINSGGSASLKSPLSSASSTHLPTQPSHHHGVSGGRAVNRSSAGTMNTISTSASGPGTPITQFSPVRMSKADLPRGPDPALDPAGYLRSLPAVRERSRIITDKALRDELTHFDVDMSKFSDVVTFVAQIIKRDYDAPFTPSIPPHGRYQHFAVGGRDRIALLLATWPNDSVDSTERCRRLIDLFLVSVLLDAGAGTQWKYTSVENRRVYRRSEGIAIASLEMFKTGLFSGNPQNKTQVDKDGLQTLTVDILAKGLQSHSGNEMAGMEGRAGLLMRLGDALAASPEVFGSDGRPGRIVDYLLAHPTTQASSKPIVSVNVLWTLLMDSLEPIWPESRTAINGISLGDAWPCSSMPQAKSGAAESHGSPPGSLSSRTPSTPTFSPFPTSGSSNSASSKSPNRVAAWESIVPFHKLTQWLTYSLMQPMQTLLKIHFAGAELLTGLPEYRNGGLFVDLGVLNLKPDDMERGLAHYREFCERTGHSGIEVAPMFCTGDDVVVEWRAVTVGFLDRLCKEVNRTLRTELQGSELSLAQLLEAGSWKGGREMAEMSRPNTKEPPILIDSDGTVF
ncbi:conserved fungal protein [Grosmannia clavigera kw1407]|uniref:Conserved fungal protein n=1 Tax=Grosmannia clavigera (strain kw1407 / UAMH 11150) TaxID=655863 RepID=F0XJN0_GROCL|nr:uncharacterized protein CMQ_2416 [Grosmannia clavigera kw1407]EFX02367.1 conserved fungal protein [Grosmannia clavigera kw1407]